MFDVGLGAAILLQFRQSDGGVVRVLADGGLDGKFGKERLPDALAHFGWASKRIDLMVGTHYDADHLDGLVPIVEDGAFEIGEAWLPPVADDSVLHAIDGMPKASDMLPIKFGGSRGGAACSRYLVAKASVCDTFAQCITSIKSNRDIPDDDRDDQPKLPQLGDGDEARWLGTARRYFKCHERRAREVLGTTGESHADDDAQVEMSARKISRELARFWPWRWGGRRSLEVHLRDGLSDEGADAPIIRSLARMQLRAAVEGINATSLRVLVAALHKKSVPIRCHYIDDGEPRHFRWSQRTRRFEMAPGRSDQVLLTLLGPSMGLIKRHRARLPLADYAAYAMLNRLEMKTITPSNQLSSAFVIRYAGQGILISGDTGFVDFPIKPRSKEFHARLVGVLDDLAIIQVAHHGGANAYFYRALQKAKSPLAKPESFFLLSHGAGDMHRPSDEFSQYIEGVRHMDTRPQVLFTGKPRAERITDFRSNVFSPVGNPASSGDVRLCHKNGSWVVEKHAVDVFGVNEPARKLEK